MSVVSRVIGPERHSRLAFRSGNHGTILRVAEGLATGTLPLIRPVSDDRERWGKPAAHFKTSAAMLRRLEIARIGGITFEPPDEAVALLIRQAGQTRELLARLE